MKKLLLALLAVSAMFFASCEEKQAAFKGKTVTVDARAAARVISTLTEDTLVVVTGEYFKGRVTSDPLSGGFLSGVSMALRMLQDEPSWAYGKRNLVDALEEFNRANDTWIDFDDNTEAFLRLAAEFKPRVKVYLDLSQMRGLEEIPEGLFFLISSLTGLSIPADTWEISEEAFEVCSSFTEIQVSEENQEYKSIDGILYSKDGTKLIFCPCARQAAVKIPDTVKEIATNSFFFCRDLKTVTIPKSVSEIEWGAFFGCSSLKTVNYLGSEAEWNAIELNKYNNEALLNAKINFK